MSFKPDLRMSLDVVRKRLLESPLDVEAVAASGPELSALGTTITAEIEAQFEILVEPNAA